VPPFLITNNSAEAITNHYAKFYYKNTCFIVLLSEEGARGVEHLGLMETLGTHQSYEYYIYNKIWYFAVI